MTYDNEYKERAYQHWSELWEIGSVGCTEEYSMAYVINENTDVMIDEFKKRYAMEHHEQDSIKKLMPCPFCGAETYIEKNDFNNYRVAAIHTCEYGPGMNNWFESEDEAIREWNTRAEE